MLEKQELPINLCHVEGGTGMLVVGVPDDTPSVIGRYRSLLRDRVRDAPIRFVRCAAAVRHAKKKEYNRPLVGGLYISAEVVEGAKGEGTICIVATRGGHRGFVTAGHIVEDTGLVMYQPRKSNLNNWQAGTSTVVSDYKGTAQSDSAFLADNTGGSLTQWRIWKSATTLYTVTGAVAVPALGTQVFMQGSAMQAERAGDIVSTNATVTFADGGVLQNQCLANYESREGDSGAPVYTKGADPQVALVGLNVGATEPEYVKPPVDEHTYPPEKGAYAVISPWANIVTDLGVAL